MSGSEGALGGDGVRLNRLVYVRLLWLALRSSLGSLS